MAQNTLLLYHKLSVLQLNITWNIYLTITDAVVHLVEFPIEGMSKKLQTLKGETNETQRRTLYLDFQTNLNRWFAKTHLAGHERKNKY